MNFDHIELISTYTTYSIRKLDLDLLVKYLKFIMRLKSIITSEIFDSIVNIFYIIKYILSVIIK